MSRLELRFAPPRVMLALAALALVGELAGLRGSPLGEITGWVIGIAVAAAGAAVATLGNRRFDAVGTTVDPRHTSEPTVLVTDGIYRLSRNPMYVGLTLVYAGLCIGLGTVVGLLVGVVLLVAWLTRFQIIPEERILAARFGDDYQVYRQRVRRWL